jgi:predicted alpha/beta-fold hydrolase
MPLISSTYRAPIGLRGGHRSTIYPTLFRRLGKPEIERERLELPDGDFMDLDWSPRKHKRLAIIGHGLEGESSAKYIRGMSIALQKRDWDTLAWNCRGCSGEPNRLLRSYHSGVSDDLGHVVDHAISEGYQEIALVGFSLGGNILLKYLGEQGENLHPEVKAGVAFSAPCDLTSSSLRLGDWENKIYMARFMDGLKDKVIQKNEVFPGKLDLSGIQKIKTFAEFDDRFTAPLNGFTDARDYWTRASAKPHLHKITVPALMVQALDDPFLPDLCFPREIAEKSRYLSLETPPHGGHVGFVSRDQEYWSESRCAEFLNSHSL